MAQKFPFLAKHIDIKYKVCDVEDNLVLIDIPREYYFDEKYSKFRGAIADLKSEEILVYSERRMQDREAERPLRAEDLPRNALLFRGYDGSLLRVFVHDGRVWYTTMRKLDARKNFMFQQKKSFYEWYKELGGPDLDPEQVGDDVLLFLIVNRENQLFSQGPVQPRLCYIGSMRKKSAEVEYDANIRLKIPVALSEAITLEQANHCLEFDEGFVVVYDADEKRRVFWMSQAYMWRKRIIGEKNPNNLFFVYCTLTDDMSLSDKDFIDKYRIKKPRRLPLTMKDKEEYILKSLRLAVPKHRKKEVSGLRKELEMRMEKIFEFVKSEALKEGLKRIEQSGSKRWICSRLRKMQPCSREECRKMLWELDGESFYYLSQTVLDLLRS